MYLQYLVANKMMATVAVLEEKKTDVKPLSLYTKSVFSGKLCRNSSHYTATPLTAYCYCQVWYLSIFPEIPKLLQTCIFD